MLRSAGFFHDRFAAPAIGRTQLRPACTAPKTVRPKVMPPSRYFDATGVGEAEVLARGNIGW